MSPAPYCSQCPSFLKGMNSCEYPGRSMLWVYLSLLPTAISILYAVASLFTRNLRHLKVFIIMELAYIFVDHLVKDIFREPRPDGACKSNYGMPSSHMTMLTTFVLLRFYYGSHLWEKALWAGVLVLEGIARMELNYHTFQQVIVGVAVGALFYYPFEAVWKVCESSIPNLEEDSNSNELGLKMENQELQ